MSRSLKSILHDAATSLLESRDRVEARDVVQRGRMLHADVFEREQERLLMEAAGRIAKAIMRELSENDQPLLSLSGLAVPTAVAVPKEKGGFYYVRTDKATWLQLLGREDPRRQHRSGRRQARRLPGVGRVPAAGDGGTPEPDRGGGGADHARERGMKVNINRRGRRTKRAVMTADEYRELIQTYIDQACSDFSVAERLAEEARQRFGAGHQ